MEMDSTQANEKPTVFGSKMWSSFKHQRNQNLVNQKQNGSKMAKESLIKNNPYQYLNDTSFDSSVAEGVAETSIQQGHSHLATNYRSDNIMGKNGRAHDQQGESAKHSNAKSVNFDSEYMEEGDEIMGSSSTTSHDASQDRMTFLKNLHASSHADADEVIQENDASYSDDDYTDDDEEEDGDGEEIVQENSYMEEPSDFTNSFLNISVDSEYGEMQHPFDEFELSVSSGEGLDDDDDEDEAIDELKDGTSPSKSIPKPSTDIKPTKSVETLHSSGDTESTTSLSTEGSGPTPDSASEIKTKPPRSPPASTFANPPPTAPSATEPTNTTATNFYVPRARQEQCQQRNYQQAATTTATRRISDTPASFRSARFQDYLLNSFHNQHAEHQSWVEHPPVGDGEDRFESILDRPFRYWKAMDQVLEYSNPEWLTHQRGRMIHHLIHFLELKIGFQDYAIDRPTNSNDVIQSGGGRLMPSQVVDEAWRALVLESTLYEKVTRDLQEFHGQPSYQYIHYSRVKTMMRHSSLGPRRGIPEELSTTQSLFQIYFREFMPASIRQVRTTPANNRMPLSASSSPSSSPRQAKSPLPPINHQRNNNGQPLQLDVTSPQLRTTHRRASDVSLRGLDCLNSPSEEFLLSPSPSGAIVEKKRVMWC